MRRGKWGAGDGLTGCERAKVHDSGEDLDIDVAITSRIFEKQGNHFGAVKPRS